MKDEGCVCIGIDLGTYNSAAAYEMPDGKVVLLQAYHGRTWQGYVIPSFVKFYANGEVEKYGEKAREELEIAPHLVVWGLKRIIGRPYQSAIEEMHRFKYPIEEAEDGSIVIPIGSKKYTPTEIVKIFLERVKKDCESDFNPIKGKITKAIITHPAYFDTNQIKAVKDAAQEAGFDEIELITEPEAAALAYKDIIDFKSEPWVMVIDWGAGTLDIVICRFSLSEEGIPRIDSVFPAYGDTHLGGIDMDDALFEEAKRLYRLEDLSPEEAGKIRSEIEKGKIYLSTNPWVQKYATYKGRLISLKMARSEEEVPGGDKEGWIVLESVLNEILEKFKTHIKFALEKEGLTPDDIDQLILVGGPAYMPCVRKAIAEIFQGNEKVMKQLERIEKEGFPVSPIEAVVRGAAIYGSDMQIKTGEKRISYGYGYLIRYKFLGLIEMEGKRLCLIGQGIPIPETGYIKEDEEIEIAPLPGDAIYISLIKQEDTLSGKKYFRIGEYEFHPEVITGPKALIQVILEADKNHINTLKIKDILAGKQSLTLEILRYEGIEIEELPPDIEEMIRRQENLRGEIIGRIEKELFGNLSEDERERIIEKIREIQQTGWISVEDVKREREKAERYINFIDANLKRFKDHRKVMECYEKLKRALEELPERALGIDEQGLYNDVCNARQELENALENILSKEEIKIFRGR